METPAIPNNKTKNAKNMENIKYTPPIIAKVVDINFDILKASVKSILGSDNILGMMSGKTIFPTTLIMPKLKPKPNNKLNKIDPTKPTGRKYFPITGAVL